MSTPRLVSVREKSIFFHARDKSIPGDDDAGILVSHEYPMSECDLKQKKKKKNGIHVEWNHVKARTPRRREKKNEENVIL